MRGGRFVGFVLVVGGCGGLSREPSPPTLIEDAVVAEVSIDQSYIAYYTAPIGLSDGPLSGSLTVKPLPSGSAVALGDGVFDANFILSKDTLYFFQEPAVDPTTSLYVGSLSIWTPRLSAPVRLSSGYVPVSATTEDHSVTLFLDTPMANQTAPGTVKLLTTGECAGMSCPVHTLAENVALTGTRMSLDGRYASYHEVRTDGATTTHDVFLVDVADGTATQVGTTTIPPQAMSLPWNLSNFSPDASKLATLSTVGGAPLQLQVISTATGTPIGWGALPAGSLCIAAAFSDSETLFVQVLDTNGNSSVYETTAGGASFFVKATQFFLNHIPAGVQRYFFFSTTPAAELAAQAPYDLKVIDLSSPGSSPVPLATSTRSTPQVSGDVTAVWFIDPYDAQTENGPLVAASLPAGRPSTLAQQTIGANFGGGTNHLFYFGSNAPSGVSNLGDGPLFRWSEGVTEQVGSDILRWASAENPPTLYVTPAHPLGIYRIPLP
jgi:hypothetical protein